MRGGVAASEEPEPRDSDEVRLQPPVVSGFIRETACSSDTGDISASVVDTVGITSASFTGRVGNCSHILLPGVGVDKLALAPTTSVGRSSVLSLGDAGRPSRLSAVLLSEDDSLSLLSPSSLSDDSL